MAKKFSILAEALIEMGESLRQMADVKYSLDDNIKQNFLEPLHHLQTKDLKEVMVGVLLMHFSQFDTYMRLQYSMGFYIVILSLNFYSIIVKNCKDDVWIMIANDVDRQKVCNRWKWYIKGISHVEMQFQ